MAAFAAVIELSSLGGTEGFRLDGTVGNSGHSVSNAGDVNGDGLRDMIIGAPGAESSWVVFGSASGFASSLDSSNGFRINGAAAGDKAGFSVSAAGDIDGDGFADLIIGSPYSDFNGRTDSGAAFVIFGEAPTTAVTRTGTAAGNTLLGGDLDDTLSGLAGNDRLYGLGGDDNLDGGNDNDRLNGGAGMDTMTGGDGNDRFVLADGDFAAGEAIDGGAGVDTIEFSELVEVDFTQGTVSSVERIVGSDFNDLVTLSSAQWTAFSRIDLGAGADDMVIVRAAGDISADGQPGLTGVETGALLGSAGADSITLTGRQLDAILAGDGIIDLGGSSDSIALVSNSRDLAVWGANDAAIVGLEAISFASAVARATADLSGQSEGFSLTGGAFADRLTGGSGEDLLEGGAGADVLTGGGGLDTFVLVPNGTIDRIEDFTAFEDTLQVYAANFGGGLTGGGVLPAARFVAAVNPLATTSGSGDGLFLYDTFGGKAGTLYWDVNGGSASDAVAIARLSGTPALTADFISVV